MSTLDEPLHGTQAFGGIHAKQWEHRGEKARGCPGPEEPASAFRPKHQGPDESDGDEANAPNRAVGVSNLQVSAENLIRSRLGGVTYNHALQRDHS